MKVGRAVEPDVASGVVRISASEGFAGAVLAPSLGALRSAHPGLRVEMAANSGFLSPSRREVDMAITLSVPDSSRLVVEPLTHYQLAVYASPAYLADRTAPGSIQDLSGHEVIGYVDDLIYASELRYLDEMGPGLTPHLASSSIRAQRDMIAAGAGVGVLPCFLAEGLTRVLSQDVLIERRFWLSTHKDVHGAARLRAVRRWVKALCREQAMRLNPYGAQSRLG